MSYKLLLFKQPKVLNDAFEKELVEYILKAAAIFYGIMMDELRLLGQHTPKFMRSFRGKMLAQAKQQSALNDDCNGERLLLTSLCNEMNLTS